MTLFMIGIGLADKDDITVKGLNILKKCELVYLEGYTSKLQCSVKELEEFYGKKITIADRNMVENKADEIISKAKEKDVAFLVIGDPFCATTHADFWLRAKEKNVKVEIVHNASIVSAIGVIGLEVYKYGKITSIPFLNEKIKAPVEVFEMNSKIGLHTLFLLDLDPIKGKFLSIKDAASYLISKGVNGESLAIGCARIGANDRIIKVDSLKNIGKYDYGSAPYCLVIPGKMHFMEEDMLKQWQNK
jgi:diphthine synthase